MRAFALTLLFGAAAAAQQQDFSKVEVKATKVAGNVYLLQGAGGNIAVTAGEDGVAMVDDQFAPLSPKIHAAIAQISPKPVRFLINTHWHFDHTGGNTLFADTATILAHENVRKRLLSGGKILTMTIEPAPRSALPVVTFEQGLSLWWNGEEIRAIHLRPGHTDGDTIVWFTKSNVVHMGDDFIRFGFGFPIIDLDSGGSVTGLVAALDSALAQLPKDARYIPGHGQIGTIDDLRKYRSALDEMVGIVRKGLAAGKSVEQMQKEQVLAAWEPVVAAAGSPKYVTAEVFIAMIARDLARQ